jgi:hypothetical protein
VNSMDYQQLTNLLVKVSLLAIYQLSKGSEDPISVQESIEHNSYTRPILNPVQILDIKNISDSEKEIRFAFSPDYLSTNIDLVMEYELHQLIWIFKLPQYDSGKNEVVVDDEEGQISIRSEEGVVEWLIRGTVEILNVSDLSYKLDLETLYHTVIKN